MDDIGEVMVVVGVSVLLCGGKEGWPYGVLLIVIGAALYFIDRHQKLRSRG